MADTAQRYFDDVEVGTELPPLEKGPWTNAHITRWCAAQENWERIHYDYKFATQHDGLPDVVANGNWRKYAVAQIFKDWVGHGGWLWKLSLRYRRMQVPGDMLTVWAVISHKSETDGLGFVELECGMRNQKSEETTPGAAVVVLPLKDGREVPYPFSPPPGLKRESPFPLGRGSVDAVYVTDELRSHIGKESEELESWDEITKTELRRLAQAIPDPDPIYWDEAYAKQTRFGTLVAPPLFPVDAFKMPPNEPDRLTEMMKMDPDFWGGPPGWDRLKVDVPLPLTRILNGGQDFEVFQLARLGEKLVARTCIADIVEKQGRLGRMILVASDTTYKNTKGEIVLQGRTIGIRH